MTEPRGQVTFYSNGFQNYFSNLEIAKTAPSLNGPARWKFHGAKCLCEDEVAPTSAALREIPEAVGLKHVFSDTDRRGVCSVFASEDMFVCVERDGDDLSFEICATDAGKPDAEAMFERMSELLGTEGERAGSVKLTASFRGPNGPRIMTFSVKAPAWEEMRANYPASTANGLEQFYATAASDNGRGRLAVFSGDPGTGKTYAIRAAIRELQKSLRPVLVTDPDAFLSSPDYYYGVLDDLEYEKRPLLFIMEDAARPLLAENRVEHNSPVARILNMTDGLLSRTRMDMFLVTFNEDLSELDSAVLRPGRCLARIHFPKLTVDESKAWLKANKLKHKPSGPMSLAELYALKSGGQIVVDGAPIAAGLRASVGFES